MLDYKLAPVNLAPAYWPGLGFPAIPRRLAADGGGSGGGVVAQKTSAILGAGAATLAVGTALSAGTAWVGFSTGSREQGFLSGLGYVIGSIGVLSAIGGVASLLILGIAAMSGVLPETVPVPAPQQPAQPPKTGPWEVANYA